MKYNKGFTLVEVIIIIALLTSITAVAAPSIFSAEDQAEEETCRTQMDFIVSGFQTHQLLLEEDYSFSTLEEGMNKLNAYIAKAIDSVGYISIGFSDPAQCPSNTPTDYQARIKDGKLLVYCPTHDEYSNGSLTARAPRTDPTKYGTLEEWTGGDNNWVVGDHESFFILPIEDQFYHMEIGFRMFAYDDGDMDADDADNDPIYDYHYGDKDWYLEIPAEHYPEILKAITAVDDGNRPYGYDMKNYNPPKKELSFALAIDLQETEGGYNFSSNALELKNINSNAAEDLTVDIAKESIFTPEDTVDKPHNRQFFDEVTDWLIVDIVPIDGNSSEKLMIVHMLDSENVFQRLFATSVPIADPDQGNIKFAFFMGRRVEDLIDTDDKNVKNGRYYADAFPSPVQVQIDQWVIDYDGQDQNGRLYSEWFEDGVNYSGYTVGN